MGAQAEIDCDIVVKNGEVVAESVSSENSSGELDRLQWGRLADWGQLVRLPTVFTLLSNCFAAAAVAGSNWWPLTGLIPTLLASVCAYWAGMILNDVVDVEDDRRDRPKRPLAARRISVAIANQVAIAMLLICPILILGVTAMHESQPLWQGAAFVSAVGLALFVRAYDSPLKKTPVGPLLMGGCRALNILMVGFTMLSLTPVEGQGHTPLPPTLLYFAAGIGLYIVGVTVFAKSEEENSSESPMLVFGLVLEMVGLMFIAFLPRWFSGDKSTFVLHPSKGYPLLIGLIGLTVANRSGKAIAHPVSRKVILAVKHALLTLILIDAAVVLMWLGPYYGVGVVALLVPAMWAAIRVRTT